MLSADMADPDQLRSNFSARLDYSPWLRWLIFARYLALATSNSGSRHFLPRAKRLPGSLWRALTMRKEECPNYMYLSLFFSVPLSLFLFGGAVTRTEST